MMRHHASRNGLRHKKTAAQVRIEHKIPVIPRYIESRLAHIAACIVHEYMNLPECGFGLGSHVLDAPLIAHVELERDDTTAQRFYFRLKRCEGFAFAAGENQVSTSTSQSAGKVLAQPAAGSGDERDLSGEIKERFAHRAASAAAGDGSSTTFIKLG